MKLDPRQRNAAGFAREEQGVPFGTLKIKLPTVDLPYPTAETLVDRLINRPRPGFDLKGGGAWLEVGTLNNKLICLNLSHLADIQLFSDDGEAMPFFSSPEVYPALTKRTPIDQLGPLAAGERAEVTRHIIEAAAVPFVDEEEAVIREMKCVVVLHADGGRRNRSPARGLSATS